MIERDIGFFGFSLESHLHMFISYRVKDEKCFVVVMRFLFSEILSFREEKSSISGGMFNGWNDIGMFQVKDN